MKGKSKDIHILISVILFVVMRIILGKCTGMGITPAGASALSLFISTIYLWITYGSGWTSLISIALLAFTGICPSSTVLANSFGNSTTVICIGTLALSVALEETGVTTHISNWFITRKFVNNRPYVFMLMFFLAEMVVTYVIEATAAMIVFVALAKSLLESLGYTKEDKFSKSIYLGVLWLVCAAMAATPIGHPVTILMLNTLSAVTGSPVSWLKYMAVGIPFSLVTLAIVMLIIRFVIRPDCEKFKVYDTEEIRKTMQPLSKRGKVVSAVYLVLIIVWLLPDFISSVLPKVGEVLSSVGTAIPSLIAFAVLGAIRVDGEPALDYEKTLKKLHWPTIWFIACIFVYASIFSLESGGINVFLKNLVSPLTEKLSMTAMVVVFLALVALVTNFASNGVTGIMGMTVCAPVLLTMTGSSVGIVTAFGVLATILCNFGIATPGGSGFVAIGQKDGYITAGETFKYGMLAVTLFYLSVIAVFWPLAKAIFA